MKRVETVSVNGVIFSINDDAYRILNDYLDSLYKYFEHEKGGDEIIADIETRIAELFAERAGGISQVITDRDVLHVIETLGSLEDITNSDSDSSDNPVYSSQKKHVKRLYRDSDHSILGGVCSGIAAWLEISPVFVRLIFIACFVFYGISVLVYFLLLLIIPLAKTTAQKLEMQGQPINISNIERSIRGNMSSSGFKPLSDRFACEFDGVNNLFRIIWNVVRIVAGIILCLTGISIALSLCCLFLLPDFVFERNVFPFNGFLPHVISVSSYNTIFISMILFTVLTVAACLYWGVAAMAGIKVKYPQIHVVLLIIWFLTIPVIAIYGVRAAGSYIEHGKSNVSIPVNAKDTIYLSLKAAELDMSNDRFYYDKETNCFYGKPNMYIRKGDKSVLKIAKMSRGRNKRDAFNYAKNIEYEYYIKDSLIAVSPYFTIEPLDEWKNQQLDITLTVPENTVIIIDESLCYADIIVHFRWSGHDGHACKWIMRNGRLEAIDE